MQKLIQFLTRRRCKSYCQFGQKLPPPYILLSINDVPAIREIFTGFQFKEVSLRYSINKETTTEADELLIANYPIKKIPPSKVGFVMLLHRVQ